MIVLNIHERVLNALIAKVGELIDSLASPDDKLWPHDRWNVMKFDRPLSVGASGGHGPIRYFKDLFPTNAETRKEEFMLYPAVNLI